MARRSQYGSAKWRKENERKKKAKEKREKRQGKGKSLAAVKDGDTVKVNYTGRLADGSVFDSTDGRDPFQFTLGEKQIISGFEQAVIGMNPGESKIVRIEADQAYGPYHEDFIQEVARDSFPEGSEPELGDQYESPSSDDKSLVVTVIEITDSKVKLDANHALAGKDLTFNIELVEIVLTENQA